MRCEWNQETPLRDKYQIYKEWRDRLFYLSTRIYLYFLELFWGYVLQLFNYWPDCKEGIIFFFGVYIIVNGGDWLWSPANIKGANKDAKIYVGRSTTLHNLLFCVHTLCMNYVTSTFLLVSSSVRSKQLLCFVQGQGQKREQKHTTKNFVGFHNHSLY